MSCRSATDIVNWRRETTGCTVDPGWTHQNFNIALLLTFLRGYAILTDLLTTLEGTPPAATAPGETQQECIHKDLPA